MTTERVRAADEGRGARHRAILAALQADRQVDVSTLSATLGVSGMTIRRDLAELDRTGQLHRVHGGAVPRRAPGYGTRATTMAAEKARIAEVVADLVRPGSAVGLDSGTTCGAVASALAARPDLADLTVVTNSLHAATAVRAGGARVLVLGGLLTDEQTLVRPQPIGDGLAVHLDVLVLGCGGVTADAGVTYFDPAEVEVRRALVAVADRIVLAADHTKFDRTKAMVLGGVDVLDVLVTDTPPPEPLAGALRRAGTTVLVSA